MQVPTCVKFKFSSVSTSVTLQGSTIVQAQDSATQALLSLFGFCELVGPHQTNSLEALSHHNEFHPLSGQSYQSFL